MPQLHVASAMPAAAVLSAEQVAQFHRDGALGGIQAVDPATAARNRKLFDERERRDGAAAHYVQIHVEDKWAWELVTAPRVVAAAQQLLGTDDVFCLATHGFCKAPGDPGFVGWWVGDF